MSKDSEDDKGYGLEQITKEEIAKLVKGGRKAFYKTMLAIKEHDDFDFLKMGLTTNACFCNRNPCQCQNRGIAINRRCPNCQGKVQIIYTPDEVIHDCIDLECGSCAGYPLKPCTHKFVIVDNGSEVHVRCYFCNHNPIYHERRDMMYKLHTNQLKLNVVELK